MSNKIKRYDMRTLGGGHDYSHHVSEDGDWCCTDDVTALETQIGDLREKIAKLKSSRDKWIARYREITEDNDE